MADEHPTGRVRRSETGCVGDPDEELRLAGVHPDQTPPTTMSRRALTHLLRQLEERVDQLTTRVDEHLSIAQDTDDLADRLAAALAEVLGTLGESCGRYETTGWIPAWRVRDWQALLAEHAARTTKED